jgi:hypothetical protein
LNNTTIISFLLYFGQLIKDYEKIERVGEKEKKKEDMRKKGLSIKYLFSFVRKFCVNLILIRDFNRGTFFL